MDPRAARPCNHSGYARADGRLRPSNIIVGFAAVQAIAFFYALTDKDPKVHFPPPTYGWFIAFGVATFVLYGAGALWCGRQANYFFSRGAGESALEPQEVRRLMWTNRIGRTIAVIYFLLLGGFAMWIWNLHQEAKNQPPANVATNLKDQKVIGVKS